MEGMILLRENFEYRSENNFIEPLK